MPRGRKNFEKQDLKTFGSQCCLKLFRNKEIPSIFPPSLTNRTKFFCMPSHLVKQSVFPERKRRSVTSSLERARALQFSENPAVTIQSGRLFIDVSCSLKEPKRTSLCQTTVSFHTQPETLKTLNAVWKKSENKSGASMINFIHCRLRSAHANCWLLWHHSPPNDICVTMIFQGILCQFKSDSRLLRQLLQVVLKSSKYKNFLVFCVGCPQNS